MSKERTVTERLDDFIEFATTTKKFADVSFYEDVKSYIRRLEEQRNVAFTLSKCECAAEECCQNIIREMQKTVALENENAALKATIARMEALPRYSIIWPPGKEMQTQPDTAGDWVLHSEIQQALKGGSDGLT